MTYELGDVVAERRLEAVAGGGARGQAVVRIGRPRPDPLSEHGDWCCPHRTEGLGDERAEPPGRCERASRPSWSSRPN